VVINSTKVGATPDQIAGEVKACSQEMDQQVAQLTKRGYKILKTEACTPDYDDGGFDQDMHTPVLKVNGRTILSN